MAIDAASDGILAALGAAGSSLLWAHGSSSVYAGWVRRVGAVEVSFARVVEAC